MRYFRLLLLLSGLLNVVCLAGESDRAIASPDGTVNIFFTLQADGVPAYRIRYRDKPVVSWSRLGMEPDLLGGFTVRDAVVTTHAGQWENPFGQQRLVPDNYTQLQVRLAHAGGTALTLTFRAYNEGAALRYTFDALGEGPRTFTGERTEFRFPEGTEGYAAHGTEGEYRRLPVAAVEPFCERPLTLVYTSGLYASLSEAANTNYPRMLLSPGGDNALVSALGGHTSNTERANQRHDPTVTVTDGQSSPWRLFIVAQRPGELLERSYLTLNLNAPCAIEDTSWLKPGKVMRDMTLTTANSKAIIDFAETAGLQYVHLDSKWYGSEGDDGDAAKARAEGLDIQEIIRYGRDKGIGVIVYVDRRQLKRQRDEIFPLYEQWGVKGVKPGFVPVGPQEETAWLVETVQKAAEHHLLLNIHDGFRAGGINRTWPNLMTVEGIRGNEHMPTPEHNCTLPFTRYVGGMGDYTVCYYEDRLKTTHAHQLAMAVVSFSPLQYLFWYDSPDEYEDEPEIEFFRHVPTVWDETRVLQGAIGEYAVIARRSGGDWYLGAITNSQARQVLVPLAFLDADRFYMAHFYTDDDSAPTKTQVRVRSFPVDGQMTLKLALQPGGGAAIRIAAD